MKKKRNIKRLSAIGLSAAMAATLAFGAAFSDFSLDTADETVNGGVAQTVQGGGC